MRHERDFYETLPRELLFAMDHVNIDGRILEPCAGGGAISNPLREKGFDVITNDFQLDLLQPDNWDRFGPIDWVWMNPPFKHASLFLKQAYRVASKGVICYLRLTFLEPCEDRAAFLLDHPVNKLLVLPRSAYKEGTSSDTVTRAWFVWEKDSDAVDKIRFLPSERILGRIGRG